MREFHGFFAIAGRCSSYSLKWDRVFTMADYNQMWITISADVSKEAEKHDTVNHVSRTTQGESTRQGCKCFAQSIVIAIESRSRLLHDLPYKQRHDNVKDIIPTHVVLWLNFQPAFPT